jgi:BirA family biotin operon repressor/biotin-[acetyl-CoA-carboxylase] ligase
MSFPARFRLIEHAELDSTNSEALRLAGEGAADGTVIWARTQTAGRGRQGRAWQSLTGNLAISFLLRPGVPPVRLPELSLLAAVALCDALAPMLPENAGPALKWPNDVLLGGAKIAGILLEAAGNGAVVIGIGVNVAHAPAPETISYQATRLADHAPAATVPDLVAALGAVLAAWLDRWQSDGFAPVLQAWRARGPKVGDPVQVRAGSDIVAGTYRDLSPEGALLLDTPTGLRRVTAGDVLPLAA